MKALSTNNFQVGDRVVITNYSRHTNGLCGHITKAPYFESDFIEIALESRAFGNSPFDHIEIGCKWLFLPDEIEHAD